eukprot:TRINITY_DN197_c2_g2_i1.p1 TRINITY_DN197_c2_g2~~TRINITY_DN197_c2_g2_i1.p1  ORF type:complete len:1557 (-),score=471.39 TRINITY_DN197_c2_g2_i1:185-4855(-)
MEMWDEYVEKSQSWTLEDKISHTDNLKKFDATLYPRDDQIDLLTKFLKALNGSNSSLPIFHHSDALCERVTKLIAPRTSVPFYSLTCKNLRVLNLKENDVGSVLMGTFESLKVLHLDQGKNVFLGDVLNKHGSTIAERFPSLEILTMDQCEIPHENINIGIMNLADIRNLKYFMAPPIVEKYLNDIYKEGKGRGAEPNIKKRSEKAKYLLERMRFGSMRISPEALRLHKESNKATDIIVDVLKGDDRRRMGSDILEDFASAILDGSTPKTDNAKKINQAIEQEKRQQRQRQLENKRKLAEKRRREKAGNDRVLKRLQGTSAQRASNSSNILTKSSKNKIKSLISKPRCSSKQTQFQQQQQQQQQNQRQLKEKQQQEKEQQRKQQQLKERQQQELLQQREKELNEQKAEQLKKQEEQRTLEKQQRSHQQQISQHNHQRHNQVESFESLEISSNNSVTSSSSFNSKKSIPSALEKLGMASNVPFARITQSKSNLTKTMNINRNAQQQQQRKPILRTKKLSLQERLARNARVKAKKKSSKQSLFGQSRSVKPIAFEQQRQQRMKEEQRLKAEALLQKKELQATMPQSSMDQQSVKSESFSVNSYISSTPKPNFVPETPTVPIIPQTPLFNENLHENERFGNFPHEFTPVMDLDDVQSVISLSPNQSIASRNNMRRFRTNSNTNLHEAYNNNNENKPKIIEKRRIPGFLTSSPTSTKRSTGSNTSINGGSARNSPVEKRRKNSILSLKPPSTKTTAKTTSLATNNAIKRPIEKSTTTTTSTPSPIGRNIPPTPIMETPRTINDNNDTRAIPSTPMAMNDNDGSTKNIPSTPIMETPRTTNDNDKNYSRAIPSTPMAMNNNDGSTKNIPSTPIMETPRTINGNDNNARDIPSTPTIQTPIAMNDNARNIPSTPIIETPKAMNDTNNTRNIPCTPIIETPIEMNDNDNVMNIPPTPIIETPMAMNDQKDHSSASSPITERMSATYFPSSPAYSKNAKSKKSMKDRIKENVKEEKKNSDDKDSDSFSNDLDLDFDLNEFDFGEEDMEIEKNDDKKDEDEKDKNEKNSDDDSDDDSFSNDLELDFDLNGFDFDKEDMEIVNNENNDEDSDDDYSSESEEELDETEKYKKVIVRLDAASRRDNCTHRDWYRVYEVPGYNFKKVDPRELGIEIVGWKILLQSEDGKRWCAGRIVGYSSKNDEHLILLLSEEKKLIDLKELDHTSYFLREFERMPNKIDGESDISDLFIYNYASPCEFCGESRGTEYHGEFLNIYSSELNRNVVAHANCLNGANSIYFYKNGMDEEGKMHYYEDGTPYDDNDPIGINIAFDDSTYWCNICSICDQPNATFNCKMCWNVSAHYPCAVQSDMLINNKECYVLCSECKHRKRKFGPQIKKLDKRTKVCHVCFTDEKLLEQLKVELYNCQGLNHINKKDDIGIQCSLRICRYCLEKEVTNKANSGIKKKSRKELEKMIRKRIATYECPGCISKKKHMRNYRHDLLAGKNSKPEKRDLDKGVRANFFDLEEIREVFQRAHTRPPALPPRENLKRNQKESTRSQPGSKRKRRK